MTTITIKEDIKQKNIACETAMEAVEILLSDMDYVLLHPMEYKTLHAESKAKIDLAKSISWEELNDLK